MPRRVPTVAESVGRDSRLRKALAAYGLKAEHVLAWRITRGVVTLVTRGGRKVRFDPESVTPSVRLSDVDKDGQPRGASRGPWSYLQRRLARRHEETTVE